MQEVELILALLVAVAALATIARVLRVPYPIVLVLGSLAVRLVLGALVAPTDVVAASAIAARLGLPQIADPSDHRQASQIR